MARRWGRFVENLALRRRKHTPDAIHELDSVLRSPEVDVKRVELIVVFVLVVGIVGWQMPLFVPLNLADGKGDEASVLVRVM
jgi:hypothetical protein